MYIVRRRLGDFTIDRKCKVMIFVLMRDCWWILVLSRIIKAKLPKQDLAIDAGYQISEGVSKKGINFNKENCAILCCAISYILPAT